MSYFLLKLFASLCKGIAISTSSLPMAASASEGSAVGNRPFTAEADLERVQVPFLGLRSQVLELTMHKAEGCSRGRRVVPVLRDPPPQSGPVSAPQSLANAEAISVFRVGRSPPRCRCSVCGIASRPIIGIHQGFDGDQDNVCGLALWAIITQCIPVHHAPDGITHFTSLYAFGYRFQAYETLAAAEADWRSESLRFQLYDFLDLPPQHCWFLRPPSA